MYTQCWNSFKLTSIHTVATLNPTLNPERVGLYNACLTQEQN